MIGRWTDHLAATLPCALCSWIGGAVAVGEHLLTGAGRSAAPGTPLVGPPENWVPWRWSRPSPVPSRSCRALAEVARAMARRRNLVPAGLDFGSGSPSGAGARHRPAVVPFRGRLVSLHCRNLLIGFSSLTWNRAVAVPGNDSAGPEEDFQDFGRCTRRPSARHIQHGDSTCSATAGTTTFLQTSAHPLGAQASWRVAPCPAGPAVRARGRPLRTPGPEPRRCVSGSGTPWLVVR